MPKIHKVIEMQLAAPEGTEFPDWLQGELETNMSNSLRKANIAVLGIETNLDAVINPGLKTTADIVQDELDRRATADQFYTFINNTLGLSYNAIDSGNDKVGQYLNGADEVLAQVYMVGPVQNWRYELL